MIGNKKGTGGVGILLSAEQVEKVFDINRVSDCIIMIKLAIGNKIITVLSCYAPQVGLDNIIKDTFYDQLEDTIRKVGADETLVICGNLNGHIVKQVNGNEGIHSGYGYDIRNKESEHILEFAIVHNLVVGNSYFTKKDNHLITYQSEGISSQTDYILVRRSDFKLVRDIEVIPGEEVVTQHRMFVSDIEWKFTKQNKKAFTPKLCKRKLKDQDKVHKLQDELNDLLESDANLILESVEDK